MLNNEIVKNLKSYQEILQDETRYKRLLVFNQKYVIYLSNDLLTFEKIYLMYLNNTIKDELKQKYKYVYWRKELTQCELSI